MSQFWTGFTTGVIGLMVVLALPLYVLRCTLLVAIDDANQYRSLFEELRRACDTKEPTP